MNRIVIPLYYGLPLWTLFAGVAFFSLVFDSNALNAKHGGLVFGCVYFAFLSSLPVILIAAGNSRSAFVETVPQNARRRSTACGMIGAAVLVILYFFGQNFPYPIVTIFVWLAGLFGVLIYAPFFLCSHLAGSSNRSD